MDEGDKIIEKTMWYLDHPILFKMNYFFTEIRKLANWEVYIIITICMVCGIVIGYVMGSGKIPFS